MSRPSPHRFFSLEYSIRAREVVLLVLLAALAGLSMYVARTDTTAFGLLSKPIEQDFVPVVVDFHTDILDDAPFLDLNVEAGQEKEVTQVNGAVLNPKTPAAPLTIQAQNARTGTEVVVSWTLPESSLTLRSNLYRKASTATAEELIAEHVEGEIWKDAAALANTTYTYRLHTVAQDLDVPETWYESTEGLTVTATPKDTIAPPAPTQAMVEPVVTEDLESALRITWTHPEDAESVKIYRSQSSGSRGTLAATVLVTDTAEYIDTTAPDNITVWYTLVSVDAAGNTSSEDFALPVPGNPDPFNYGVLLR